VEFTQSRMPRLWALRDTKVCLPAAVKGVAPGHLSFSGFRASGRLATATTDVLRGDVDYLEVWEYRIIPREPSRTQAPFVGQRAIFLVRYNGYNSR